MSLSAREQQALDCIADGLARSEPELASLLATFTRLASDEEMPVREKIRTVRRDAREAHRNPRHPRLGSLWRLYRRLGLNRALVLLWLVTNIALLAVALVIGNGGSPQADGCRQHTYGLGRKLTSPYLTAHAVLPQRAAADISRYDISASLTLTVH